MIRRLPKRAPLRPAWRFFSVQRAERSKAAAGWLIDNFVSGSLPAPATDHDLVSFICSTARKPIQIVSISERLREKEIIRGTACFAMPGDLLDGIAMSHDKLEWWVTAQGLHMDVVAHISAVPKLSAFDRFTGPLLVRHWETNLVRKNTRLSTTSLETIAIALDLEQFEPLDVLQPAQKKELLAYNAVMSRKGIRSFEGLSKSPRFVRMIRKHLAGTRTRYIKALGTEVGPTVRPIPKIFYCTNRLVF